MAQIYQKTVSDKTNILAPREFFLRPFDFLLWTEMRFGIYYSLVTSGGDNADAVNESVTVNTAADRLAYGLKDSATNDLPGFGAALFLGGVTRTGSSSDIDSYQMPFPSGLSAAGYHETTIVGGGAGQSLGNVMVTPAASGATGYNGFFALQFVITNRGLASQSVAIAQAAVSPITGTDYSAQALRLQINNALYGTPVAVAWNDGAIARVIPDAVYIRLPFYSNRIRISAMRAIRYAP